MNKYKKLINNSMVFAVGNLGSKLMQFIMVPLYSFTLTTSDFGKVDVLTTIISLMSLAICLDMSDAVFRFALDKFSDKKKIFSIGFYVVCIASVISILLSIPLKNIFSTYPIIYAAFLLSFTMLNSLVSNFARAIGFVKHFAAAGIINTLIMGLLNLILLIPLHLGMAGYMISMIAGLASATVYLMLTCSLYEYISINAFDKKLFKKMCKYSLPLIPNGIAWWLNSASDRIFIVSMMSAGANGIYAMANKIPNMLSMLTNIFFQSWQISAVEEYNDKDSKHFISNVFSSFLSFMFLGALVILLIIEPLFKLIIDKNYFVGWRLTPFLLLAIIYASVASFLGTIYTATKNTVPVFTTTVWGAILNILLTIILIPELGLTGAAFANVLSFGVVSALRLKDIIRVDKIKLKISKILLLHIIYILCSAIILLINNYLAILPILICFILLQCILDKESGKIVKAIIASLKNILLKLGSLL